MRRLFRILHWQARARYWRTQAQIAQKEVARLKLSLLAERTRNMYREDTFVSATVMGSRNMYGLAPRSGPALPEPNQPALQVAPDPFTQLPWADRAEFETEWWPLAEKSGITKQKAQQDFMRELAGRRQLNDEPFGIQ